MGKKKKITQTVAEFRAWIEGIEEMQEASWHPSAAQWKKIRTRIDTIQEEAVGLMTGLHSSTNLHVPMAPSAPSRLDIVEIVEPSTSALVNHKAPPATTTDARLPAPKTGVTAMTDLVPDGKGGVMASTKTPDIDTSAGNYKSPFN